MDMLTEIEKMNKIVKILIIKETYIDGDIDKFIKVINEKPKLEIDEFLKNETESTKEFLEKMSITIGKLDLITEVLETKKLEKNRKDLIKIGAEMLEIAKELIEIGKED